MASSFVVSLRSPDEFFGLILDNGKKHHHVVSTGGSFGASTLQQEIGLSKAKSIKKIIIHSQNGTEQILENVRINQKIKVKEGTTDFAIVHHSIVPFVNVEHHDHKM